MSIYTATIIFSFSVAVPIIILIYKTVSSVNKATSNFNFDERAIKNVGASGPKVQVKPVNVDYAKSSIRRTQSNVTPIRAGTLASADRSLNIVVMDAHAPEVVNTESVCELFDSKVSANTY